MKFFVGCDHAGYNLKVGLISVLQKEKQIEIIDCGTDSEQSVDYPDYIHKVADGVQLVPNSKGLIICGSGNGAAIVANKHKKIRAALCWNEKLARLAREHNDANILSLPARFIDFDLAFVILKTFIDTDFEGGRHLRRVRKIECQ